MAHGKYCEESLSLSFFLIQVLLVIAFINKLPTICLIRVVNETPSSLTRMNKEWQEIAFSWKVLNVEEFIKIGKSWLPN